MTTCNHPPQPLQQQAKHGKIKRKVEIFSQISRHITAILYLVAELYLGERPEKL